MVGIFQPIIDVLINFLLLFLGIASLYLALIIYLKPRHPKITDFFINILAPEPKRRRRSYNKNLGKKSGLINNHETKKTFSPLHVNYVKQGALFTQLEAAFLTVLKRAVEGQYHIFGKVRVADLIDSGIDKELHSEDYWISFNEIAKKHVDYVITDKDYHVVCVIELNDATHNRLNRRRSDALKKGAFHSAKVPLVFIPVKESYSIEEIRRQITEAYAKYYS